MDEALTRLRAIYVHQGPPIPVDQLGWSPDFAVGDGDQ